MMKIIKKFFWDCDKEEKWLNELSSSGLAFCGYTWGKFTFETCEPGEFIFRKELLKKPVRESSDYFEFMETLDAELVCTYGNWAYFKRKTDAGPFDIYSDRESKLLHYRRIASIWTCIACGQLSAALMLIYYGFASGSSTGLVINLIFGSLLLLASLFFFVAGSSYRRNIKRLKSEEGFRE